MVGLHESGGVPGVLNNIHGVHVRSEFQVGGDPVPLAHVIEVLQQFQPTRLSLHANRSRIVRVIVEVVDRELGLKLGRRVGVHDPGSATNDVVAVEDHKVLDALLEEAQGRTKTPVASSDDGVHVRPRHLLAREALCALHDRVCPDLLFIPQGAVLTNAPLNEGERLPVGCKLSCKHVPHFNDLCSHGQRQRERLVRTVDFELHVTPGLALCATPWDVGHIR
mmetsp:Transcript_94598/g.276473  ORF Transcript_94598/g.276473 Transcript_94598/m.276473 type:complete len:222 (+) Transcript_94598:1605-2270(+)